MEHAVLNESSRTKDKMVDDFKSIVSDADELLQATAKVSGEGFTLARARFSEKLKSAKASLVDAEKMIVQKAKHTATATNDYVKANPWTAVGIAAGVSLLIGFLIAKR